MKRMILALFIFMITFSGCKKFIQQGTLPSKLDKEIPYKKGSVYFTDERIEVKYVSVENYIKKDSDDIIFYLHGFNRTEFEWVEDKGFGRIFYDTLKKNDDLKSFTVVSISFGGAYLFIENAPKPYSADLESFFMNKIIPYFKERFSKKGNVYLIGHSLGGFNSLMISLRHPDKFPAVAVISPYVAPISPFSIDFDKKGKELNMPDFQVKILKSMLTNAFGNEEKWNEYNPFKLLSKNKNFPFISISDAKHDLPGFEWSIDNFNNELDRLRIEHSFLKSDGDHFTVNPDFFNGFLKRISK